MLTKTYKYFNQLTRQALFDHNDGYVDKRKSLSLEISDVKDRYGLEKIYRFDLGENVDGYSPRINDFIDCLNKNNLFREELNTYPDISHRFFREEIAALHNINKDQIVISTGLDSILDLISRVFFDNKDKYLMPIPDFFLFENYSERMGAIPIFLPLEEDSNFEWTEKIIANFKNLVSRFRPKLVWLSNPCNPTGKVIPIEVIHKLITIAHVNNVFIVVDEAYIEYIPSRRETALRFLNKFKNLMVLRTFSKAYGLAGIRLGYLMTSSHDILNALLMHRQYFPATKMAIKMATLAMSDQDFLVNSIHNINNRKKSLFKQLDTLTTFKYIPSDTNIFVIKNLKRTGVELKNIFRKYGIFTSLVNINNNCSNDYIRVTIKNSTDNEYFFRVCNLIEKEVVQSRNINNLDFSLS